MQSTYFPVTLDQLGATIRYHDLLEGEFDIADVHVRTQYLNHPALTLGYRLEVDGAAVVYACDHEPYARPLATGPGRSPARIGATPPSWQAPISSSTTRSSRPRNIPPRSAGATARRNTRCMWPCMPAPGGSP